MNPTRRSPAATVAALLITALLAALLVQIVAGMRLLSPTYDEVTHLPAGYSYLATGDFRLNPQHPPLGKLLAALPLLPLRPRLDRTDPAWAGPQTDEWGFGYRFLYANDADRLLFRGRLSNALLAALLAAYCGLWARRRYGRAAAVTAVALCAFSPTLVAHARFVTFDVPLACFSTMALYHGWRFASSWRPAQAAATGVALGLALASKFSAALLPPVVLLLLAWGLLRRRAAGEERWARPALWILLTLFLAGLVVQATYFFSPDPLIWWKGLQRVNADRATDYAYYLMGTFREGGFPHYFLVAFLVKTPLPTLLLLAGTPLAWRWPSGRAWFDDAWLLLPALVFFLATSALADNLGIRYLMPVYPLLFVIVSRWALTWYQSRAARALAVILASWYAGAALWIYPDQLAYFNELAGGPANGHRWLDDSNLDWGQDLARLQEYMNEEGIDSIKLRYGRNDNPAHYGIRAVPISNAEWAGDPPPGLYAFGAHLLIRGELHARENGLKTDWLSRYEPVDRIGYSIYLFRFE